MSQSCPAVVARCSLKMASVLGYSNNLTVFKWQYCSVWLKRFCSRCAKSTMICQSCFASAGGGTAELTQVIRRSELVTVPSFSPHVLAGNNTSAYLQVSVLLKASCTTTSSAFSSAASTLLRSGIECAGLVQAIQMAFISPFFTASNISTAVFPATSGMSFIPQNWAISARCSALLKSRCAGNKFAMPPTSRPPIALGWPVSENGPAPGLPIWPVAKCKLISAAFLSVPWMLWFKPMQYMLKLGPLPNHLAAWIISASRMPQISATIFGVYSRTVSLSASKPLVCALIYAISNKPSHSITCSKPLNKATSVPGKIAKCKSAASAVSVLRGSTTMIFKFGFLARASSIRLKIMGCANAVLLPAINKQFAWSMSS